MDLVHLLRPDTVGTDSSLPFFSLGLTNLTTPFRVVWHGGNGSGDILWDPPCLLAFPLGFPSFDFKCAPRTVISNNAVGLRPRHEIRRRVTYPPYMLCSADLRLVRELILETYQYSIYEWFAELLV